MADHTDRLFDVTLKLTEQMGKLDAKFERDSGAIKTELAKQTEILTSVEEQTKKTNGRMTKAEADIQELKDINVFRKGRSAVIGAITGVVMAVVVALVTALLRGKFGL